MKAVIPVAGFGTRLRPHTYSKPKPLINVAGKPFLGYILEKLAALNPEEYIFIVGYLGEQIQHYVDSTYRLPARYVEQKELLGQAHALWLARDYIDGPIVIIFADTLFEADLQELDAPDVDGIAFVKEVEDPRRFGVVELDARGYVTRFVEKPASLENRLAVIGMYYIRNGPLLVKACEELMARGIRTRGEYFLTDALNIFLEYGQRLRVREVNVWVDCGTPEAVLETNRYLLSHGHDNSREAQREGVVIIPPVFISPSAHVRHAVIGPYATIADGCFIENAIIRDSIVDSGARIVNAVLEQSLIGRDAYVGGRFRRFNVGDSSSIDFT
ncbi:Bifunctional protein GlmU [Candidatus Thermoflexus japonica]|uniref:Bifunctional protein GlmU n=1 Tax=Candidatus Thermoflexus japonica TaxID=2035417 RepID=A0A2H5Y8E1_9CHLR|nr:Bifunctional protein GlmU [Candidatus Thermoflexus japonica]